VCQPATDHARVCAGQPAVPARSCATGSLQLAARAATQCIRTRLARPACETDPPRKNRSALACTQGRRPAVIPAQGAAVFAHRAKIRVALGKKRRVEQRAESPTQSCSVRAAIQNRRDTKKQPGSTLTRHTKPNCKSLSSSPEFSWFSPRSIPAAVRRIGFQLTPKIHTYANPIIQAQPLQQNSLIYFTKKRLHLGASFSFSEMV